MRASGSRPVASCGTRASSSAAGWISPSISSYCEHPRHPRTVENLQGGSLKAIVLSAALAAVPAYAGENATFEWFEYTGRDATFSAPLPSGSFHNPILAGYYPDPAVERVG